MSSTIHELNFLTNIDSYRFFGNILSDMLSGEIYHHYPYHHLPDAFVPSHKLKGVSGLNKETSVNPNSKRGRLEGAKTIKDPSKEASVDSKNIAKKRVT